MTLLTELAQAVVAGDHGRATELTRRAIEQHTPPQSVLNEGLIAGMDIVGRRFKAHEIFLPDVLLAARAMTAGMDELRPLLVADAVPSLDTVVLGSVRGDLHDIGKNLVAVMLRGAGFEVIDLGHDVAPEKLVQAAMDHGAAVIGMSALLTTTMPAMREVVELLRQEGPTPPIKTIVGGAPVTAAFAAEIGADAYGFDAANAVEVVQRLVRER